MDPYTPAIHAATMPLLATLVREHAARMVGMHVLGSMERSSFMNASVARRAGVPGERGTIDHRGVFMWADGIVHTLA